MTAAEILSELNARQVELVVAGDRLRFRPVQAISPDLREALRTHKAELMELIELRGWPEESRNCVRRFHRPEARLYPFIGKTVATREGRGRLIGVFADRAVVTLASSRVACFMPSEVRPPEVDHGQDDDHSEVVH